MDFFSIVGACVRRWYVTLPLLVVTAMSAYLAYQSVETEYTASRWIVVLPSLEQDNLAPAQPQPVVPSAEAEPPSNPYAGQGGSRFAVAVLTRNLNSTGFEARMAPRLAGRGTFEANAANEQPLVEIVAVATRQQDVYPILDAVVDEAALVLDEVQVSADAPPETRYRIAPAVPAGPAEDVTPSRFRAAGAVAVVGLGLAAILAVAFDGVLARRQERRKGLRDEGRWLPANGRPHEPGHERASRHSAQREAADRASTPAGLAEAPPALVGSAGSVSERTEATRPRAP